MRYVYQVTDPGGIQHAAGVAFEVMVDVTVPRYAKQGHSFVAIYRNDDEGRRICVVPSQEVPGSASQAALRLLATLGWTVETSWGPPRKRHRGYALSVTSARERPDSQDWYEKEVWDD